MPSPPVISVIIPTYNRGALLIRAVDSVLGQTWLHWEVILIDDGSTDDTQELVARLCATHWSGAPVKYARQANAGAAAARNHGLRLATGDLIQFLDSDDELRPQKLASQVRKLGLAENALAACCTCYGFLAQSSAPSASSSSSRIGLLSDDPAVVLRALASRAVHVMATPSPLWRSSFLVGKAGWREDIGLGDDLEYHARLLADAKRLCFVDAELFVVQEHHGTRMSTDAMCQASLLSLLRTRKSVEVSLRRRGLWDERVQRAFLSAMRTIYANALALPEQAALRELEAWLWSLSGDPVAQLEYRAMILLRRLFGGRVLLRVHDLIKGARGA